VCQAQSSSPGRQRGGSHCPQPAQSTQFHHTMSPNVSNNTNALPLSTSPVAGAADQMVAPSSVGHGTRTAVCALLPVAPPPPQLISSHAQQRWCTPFKLPIAASHSTRVTASQCCVCPATSVLSHQSTGGLLWRCGRQPRAWQVCWVRGVCTGLVRLPSTFRPPQCFETLPVSNGRHSVRHARLLNHPAGPKTGEWVRMHTDAAGRMPVSCACCAEEGAGEE
jgi:hypothetical protein